MVVVAMRMVVVAEKVVVEKAVEMKEITSFLRDGGGDGSGRGMVEMKEIASFLRLSHFANHR